MKPAPFPLALNIGTDIVHLPRITRLISRPGGYLTRFTRRILCDQEQQDFRTRFAPSSPPKSPAQSNQTRVLNLRAKDESQKSVHVTADMARWLAGRFAAKEAARKAAPLGAASIGWKDVLVRVGGAEAGLGRPEVVYLGSEGGRVGRLSISHDGEYVVATVLAAG